MSFKKFLTAMLIAAMVLSSMAMPVSAAGTLYVGTTDTNNAVTYDSISEAMENASDGDTIEIASGTYNDSIDVTTKNVTINRYSDETEGTVTIDATNEKYGDAFYNETNKSLSLGDNVEVSENVVTVDSANAEGTEGTYATIQDGVNASDSNTTVSIVPGEYNESVNVTSEYLGFVNNDPSSGDVTINATNTTSGEAFTGNYSEDIRVGENIVVEENVLGVGSGAIGEGLTATFMGIPIWAMAIVAALLGYVYYEEQQ